MHEPRYKTSCVDRFLRYVEFDTQSREEASGFPSSEGQLELQRVLAGELRELGLSDVDIDSHGYLFATVPATTRKQNVPVIGFIAHVDTSPEVSGAGVKPVLHHEYQGQDLVLPDDPEAVIRLSDNPDLREQIGNAIITASGTTLLGADDKAGVAEIMGAVEYLVAHPEIGHGNIRIGFTTDQEIGHTGYFDVERFGAHRAYTIDGQGLGQLQTESFSADTLHLAFHGLNTHPGYAKGRMVNAIKVASDFIQRLPRDGMSPETTEGYEGYAHPYIVDAAVECTRVKVLIRDFETAGLADTERRVEALARAVVVDHPGARLEVELEQGYRNMKEVLDGTPEVVERAEAAIRRAGLEPRREPLRGGTDGSRLSFMGLPTPNLFAGEHNFHSRDEWISTFDMAKAVEVIIELCREWEERAPDLS